MSQTTAADQALGNLVDHIDTMPPLERIKFIGDLAARLDLLQRLAVEAAREPDALPARDRWSPDARRPATWQEIGDALGVTRSAAHQRYG